MRAPVSGRARTRAQTHSGRADRQRQNLDGFADQTADNRELTLMAQLLHLEQHWHVVPRRQPAHVPLGRARRSAGSIIWQALER